MVLFRGYQMSVQCIKLNVCNAKAFQIFSGQCLPNNVQSSLTLESCLVSSISIVKIYSLGESVH